jgi:hypothetical protein
MKRRLEEQCAKLAELVAFVQEETIANYFTGASVTAGECDRERL